MVCRALRLSRGASSCHLFPCGNGAWPCQSFYLFKRSSQSRLVRESSCTLDLDFHRLFSFILDIISTSQTATTRGTILSDFWPHESVIQVSLRVARGKGIAHRSMVLYIFIYNTYK